MIHQTTELTCFCRCVDTEWVEKGEFNFYPIENLNSIDYDYKLRFSRFTDNFVQTLTTIVALYA